MKNPYNLLVAVLVIICLADAAYRLYSTYERLTNSQQSHLVKYAK